jgi:LmbE family N-acetylglucosaminyl deacetylase
MSALFHARDDGTSESEWSLSWLPRVAVVDAPKRSDRLLVLAAHPDDETLGAGGLIALAATLDVAVTVVLASDGEQSHPASPTTTAAELAAIRRREVAAAVALLHPGARLHLLGWPDSELAACEGELATQVQSYAAGCTLVLTPWVGDQHPDHSACARVGATVAASVGARHWQYPIWAWLWAGPDSGVLPREVLRRVRLPRAILALKAGALACHASQHQALSGEEGDEALLTEGMLEHFRRDYEIFVTDGPSGARAPAAVGTYFDELYSADADPWGLAERFYEQRKRDLVLASLPRPRFRRAFEPGCAIGLLTQRLAARCDQVIATDTAQPAIDQARVRCAPYVNVVLERGAIPGDWPGGEFDLIVLSEVGYYCVDLTHLVDQLDRTLSIDGVVVACHWRHPAPDHPHQAEAVHAAVGERFTRVASHLEDDFMLEVWSRDGVSVATADGIVQ